MSLDIEREMADIKARADAGLPPAPSDDFMALLSEKLDALLEKSEPDEGEYISEAQEARIDAGDGDDA